MKGDENAQDYECFYNPQAEKLLKWMFAENNNLKRAKLYRTACRMEYRYRKYYDCRPKPGIRVAHLYWLDPRNQPKPVPQGGTGAVNPMKSVVTPELPTKFVGGLFKC